MPFIGVGPIAAPGERPVEYDTTRVGTTVIGPPTARVTQREIKGCIALLHPETNEVLVLNETATDIWHLSDGTMDLNGIVEALAKSYRVHGGTIHDDVERTVLSLLEHGFITISDP